MKRLCRNHLNIINKPFVLSTKGAVAVEFAVVAPVFFMVLIALFELSLIFFTYTVLEGSAARGSRAGITGYKGAGGNRAQYIRNQILSLSAGYLNPANVNITILSYSTFSNVGQPEPCIPAGPPPCPGPIPGVNFIDVNGNGVWDADQGRSGAGRGGEIVSYKVEYAWPVITPLMGYVIGNPFLITAYATVKNEGFE